MKKIRFVINILITIFLVVMIVHTFYDIYVSSYVLTIRHYIGFFFTLSTLLYLFFNRNIFTLSLGVNLLVGNFSGLTVLTNLTTTYAAFGIAGFPIPLYWGQPFYSVLLFIYLLFNAKFYRGILSANYWENFLNRTEDSEVVPVVLDLSKDKSM
ncbi:MAG: hypothetical protein ACXVNN_01385 [Bacteroidia bacterium]